jgi:O-antigen/teichoic acid export membrane protein
VSHASVPGRSGGNAARIGRNATFRMASQVLWALSNVVALSLLGNYLHAEGYGLYAFWYALIPLIGGIADLGIGMTVTRELARDRENGRRLFGDALILKGLISAGLLVVAAVTAWTCFPPPVALLICLVSVAAVIEIAQDPSIWLFRAHERQDVEALLLVVSQLAWIGGLILAAALKLPLPWLLGAQAVAFLVRLGLGAALARKLADRPEFRPDWARIRGWIRQGLPYGLAMFGVMLHGRVAILLLQALSTTRDVAWFNVAYNLSQPFGFLSTALSLSAFPVIARYAVDNPGALRQALLKTGKYQILVSLPLMVGLFALSDRVIPLLFHGDDFARAGTALRITSLALGFIFLNLMARYVLLALDRQQVYLRAILAGLVVNAGLCLLLIPRLGFVGACIAYVAAEGAIFVICQLAMVRQLSLGDVLRQAFRPLLAAAGMGLLLAALGGVSVFLAVPVGALAYAGLLLILRAVSAEELDTLRRVATSFRPTRPARLAPGAAPSAEA